MPQHLRPTLSASVSDARKSATEVQSLLPWMLRLGDLAPANDATLHPTPTLASVFEGAIAHDRRCRLQYLTEEGVATVREVDPLAVSWRADGASLLAHCRLRGDLRSFRLERIVAAEVLSDARTVRPSLSIERFLQRRKHA